MRLAIACGLCWTVAVGLTGPGLRAAEPAGGQRAGRSVRDDDDGELARKSDILHSPQWRRAIAELGGWLATQSIYTPSEVRRIKSQFNDRVASMSSYDLEYLLDSIAVKLRLLDTPEARDAKAWLGEYLSAMSDARRAQALRNVPNILDMSADQLWNEIQRIDTLRASLRQRQQGVDARQAALATRAAAGRQATSAATAARPRPAPSHSPYRSGGGSPPFSDVEPRRMSIGVGPMGAFVMF
ncbi:MAG: hypothetical protein EBZ59_06145 [Planctomycetia bacterium]|nr:hypothetical protein [Planctomycetia bacterium]